MEVRFSDLSTVSHSRTCWRKSLVSEILIWILHYMFYLVSFFCSSMISTIFGTGLRLIHRFRGSLSPMETLFPRYFVCFLLRCSETQKCRGSLMDSCKCFILFIYSFHPPSFCRYLHRPSHKQIPRQDRGHRLWTHCLPTWRNRG